MAVGSVRFRGRAQGKFNKISFRTVLKVILSHPFLLATLLYLIILYWYFPFLFSLLVSVSPVLICTAVLLGTLLLHGQQQGHRVGNRDERSNVADSSQNGDVDYTYNRDHDGSYSNERFGDIRNETVEKEVTVSSRGFEFADFDFKDAHRVELHAPDNEERYGKTGNDRAEKSSLDVLVAEVTPNPQETHPLLGFGDSQTSHDATLKSEVESLESNQSSDDSDEDEKDENDEDDETPKAVDGDSPSPFAWTDNDQRILQELRSSEIEKNEHLESLIARVEDDGSEELENEDEEESIDGIEDDDADDEEEEEEEEDGNIDVAKDGSKQVTLWTEEDEKNLRHLGCSELERNLRLENLLARRRAKRNFSMISERNLIDLDKFVPPFPVPPISTTRVNPFDSNDDSSHHPSTVPSIPGSAPSVTLPRKNPFDSPCTSPKKVQNLGVQSAKEPSVENNLNKVAFHEIGSSSRGYNVTGNVPKPELVDKNRKEALFRRYESFSAGYNMVEDASTNDFVEFNRRDFVFRRHETFNTRTPYFSSNKPVFVPQPVDGDVWHPSLDRQLSHDTESVQSGTTSDTETSTLPIDHQQDEEAPHEGDLTSSHVETASESSEAIDSQYDDDDQDEHINATMEVHVDHVYPEQEVIHEGHDNHDATSSPSPSSSSSSSSEHDVEGSVNEDQIEHEEVEESGFSSKESLNMSEASHMSTDDDHHPVEPVYDTSPSGLEKNSPFANPTNV